MSKTVSVEFILNIPDATDGTNSYCRVLVLENMIGKSRKFMLEPRHKTYWHVVLNKMPCGVGIEYRWMTLDKECAAIECSNSPDYNATYTPTLEELQKRKCERVRRYLEVKWVDCQVVDQWTNSISEVYQNDSTVDITTHYITEWGQSLAVVGLGPIEGEPIDAEFQDGFFWRFRVNMDRYHRTCHWYWVTKRNGRVERKEKFGDLGGRLLPSSDVGAGLTMHVAWDKVEPISSEVVKTRSRYGVLTSDALYTCGKCGKVIDCPEEGVVSDTQDVCKCVIDPNTGLVDPSPDNPPSPPERDADGGHGEPKEPEDGSDKRPGDQGGQQGSEPSTSDSTPTGRTQSSALSESGEEADEMAEDTSRPEDVGQEGTEYREPREQSFIVLSPETESQSDTDLVSSIEILVVTEDDHEELADHKDETTDRNEEQTDQQQDVQQDDNEAEQNALTGQRMPELIPLPLGELQQNRDGPGPPSWYVDLQSLTTVSPSQLNISAPVDATQAEAVDAKLDVGNSQLCGIQETGTAEEAGERMHVPESDVEHFTKSANQEIPDPAGRDEDEPTDEDSQTSPCQNDGRPFFPDVLDTSEDVQELISNILAEINADLMAHTPEVQELMIRFETEGSSDLDAKQDEEMITMEGPESEIREPSPERDTGSPKPATEKESDGMEQTESPKVAAETECEPAYSPLMLTQVSPEQKMIFEIRDQLKRLKVTEEASKLDQCVDVVVTEVMTTIVDRHDVSLEVDETSDADVAPARQPDAPIEDSGVDSETHPAPCPQTATQNGSAPDLKEPKAETADSTEAKGPESASTQEGPASRPTEAADFPQHGDSEDREKSHSERNPSKSGEGKRWKGKGRQASQNKPPNLSIDSAASNEGPHDARTDTPFPCRRTPRQGESPSVKAAQANQRLAAMSTDPLASEVSSPQVSFSAEKPEASGQAKARTQGDKVETVPNILQGIERVGSMGSPEMKRARFTQASNQNRRGSKSSSALLHPVDDHPGYGREEGQASLSQGTKRRHDNRNNYGRQDQDRGGAPIPGSGSKRREGRNRRNSDSEQRNWSRPHNMGGRQEPRYGPALPGGPSNEEAKTYGRPGNVDTRRDDDMSGRGRSHGQGGRRGRDRDMYYDSPRSYGSRGDRHEGHFEWQGQGDRQGHLDRSAGGHAERGGLPLEEGSHFERPRPGQSRFGWPQFGLQGSRGPSEWPQPGLLPPRRGRRGQVFPMAPVDPRCDPLHLYPGLRSDIR